MVNKLDDKDNVPASVSHMIEDDDDIIILVNEEGEEVEFVEIAGIAYRGNFYAVLQPVELLDGMEEDEALVFKVTRGANGGDNFEIEIDEAIIKAVHEEYLKLIADLPE